MKPEERKAVIRDLMTKDPSYHALRLNRKWSKYELFGRLIEVLYSFGCADKNGFHIHVLPWKSFKSVAKVAKISTKSIGFLFERVEKCQNFQERLQQEKQNPVFAGASIIPYAIPVPDPLDNKKTLINGTFLTLESAFQEEFYHSFRADLLKRFPILENFSQGTVLFITENLDIEKLPNGRVLLDFGNFHAYPIELWY
jgi:hypothetical protein